MSCTLTNLAHLPRLIVMSRNAQALAALDAGGGTQVLKAPDGIDPWTDDFANLPAAILRRIGVTKY